MASASMYIRVKRQKATVFFQVEPTDTVLRVKSMIENLMQTPPESQKLYMDGTELEDKRSLAELKVESDGILVLALRQQDGTWEAPEVVGFDNDDAMKEGE